MEKDVIIITGACGRIGTQVVKKLGEKYRIVGFELLRAIYASDHEELVPVDLSSDESVAQAFTHIKNSYGTRIASVIHLAAYYSFSQKHSPLYESITVKGTERLLKELKGFEVEQFLFTSTMLVHAPTEPGEPITEKMPICPCWDYPLSKVHTENLIEEMGSHIPTVIFRIAGVYDNLCHSIPLSNQIQRIYEKQLQAHLFPGDASHGSSFVHMDDLVEAIFLAVERRKALPKHLPLLIGEPVTFSYDAIQKQISQLLYHRDFTTLRIPKIIAKIGSWFENLFSLRHKPFIRPWMIDFADDHYELDTSLAQKTLGWSPKHSLEGTLPKMIASLKKDPVQWYKINALHMPHHLETKVLRERR